MNDSFDPSGQGDGLRVVSRQPDGTIDLSNGSSLTSREVEILRQIALGKGNHEIADDLFLSVHTIEYYATRIYQKLGVKNRTQAALVATRLALVTPSSPGLEPATSREFQAAFPSTVGLTLVTHHAPRRSLMTAIGAGLASAALAMVAAIGLFTGLLPGVPLLTRNAEARHCVAQAVRIAPGEPAPRADTVPTPAAVCYKTFDDSIRSLGLNPDDYRPPR